MPVLPRREMREKEKELTELIIMRGLPGCGKSTWARKWVAEDPVHRAEVNRDHLRLMLHDGAYLGYDTELQIIVARDATISALLQRGVSVVSSDTNLPRRTVRDLVKLARFARAEWRLEDMTDVPLDICILRNAERTDKAPVPEHVIQDYAARFFGRRVDLEDLDQYIQDDVELYVPDPSLPPAIIVDIDGTVALKGARDPFDETRVHEDRPNLPVVDVVKMVARSRGGGVQVIFLSGRTEGCEQATVEWLQDHVLPEAEFELHMRKAGDMRKDRIVKAELFDEHVRGKYNVLCVFDDRDQCVQLWRDMNLSCFQVNYGDF